MPPRPSKPIEAVGWTFWSIWFFIWVGPCIYYMFQVTYEGVSPIGPVMFGILSAAFIAGIISWLVNSALQFRAARVRQKALDSSEKSANREK